jgi:hypothetical protein
MMTSIAKMFEHEVLDDILKVIDPLLSDSDKFKQRAGGESSFPLLRSCPLNLAAEFLAGLWRGNYTLLPERKANIIQLQARNTGRSRCGTSSGHGALRVWI